MAHRRIRDLVAIGSAAAVVAAVGGPFASPAQAVPYGHVYTVTELHACGGQGQADPVGTFTWAVQQANATPGLDQIVLPANASISFSGCFGDSGPRDPFRAVALDDVDIVGDHTTLDGYNMWLSPSGHANLPGFCLAYTAGSVLISQSGGVLAVGDLSGTHPANVQITGVTMQGLSMVAQVNKGSALIMENSTVRNTQDILGSCNHDPILVDQGQVVLRGVTWNFTDTPTQSELSAAIVVSHGVAILEDVDMTFALNGRAITAIGKDSHVYVTSSVINESGGFWTEADPFFFINSAFYTDRTGRKEAAQHVDVYDGFFEAVASSFHFGQQTVPGALSQHGKGGLWLNSSAVGANPDSAPLLAVENDHLVFGNLNSWVQATTNQTRNQLLLLFPGLMLGAPGQPGLPTGATYTSVPEAIYPPPGSVLLGFVHDAGPGGSEELKNPLNQAPILFDVFGNERVTTVPTTPVSYVRDIGAMEVSGGPVVSVTGTTATTVGLAWTPDNHGKATDPNPGPFTGWRVQWREVSNTPPPWQETDVDGWDNQATTIPGLTAGTPYEFRVAGYRTMPNPDPPYVGSYSLPTIGIPMGPIGAPTVTAAQTPGQVGIDLCWPAVDPAGHPGAMQYSVSYRKVGDTAWTPWGTPVTGTSVTLSPLTSGQPYEFAVQAIGGDGTVGGTGTAAATPYAAPTLSYPTPVNLVLGDNLTLTPTVGGVVGTPTYTLAPGDVLPAGLTFHPATGVIDGSTTSAETQALHVTVTDGTTHLSATATVQIVVGVAPLNPYLDYPDYLVGTAGVGPISATPVWRTPAPPTLFTVLSGTLPDGLSLNPTTGVVSGTPTTPTGMPVEVNIRACWDVAATPCTDNVVVGFVEVVVAPAFAYPVQANGTAGRPMTITPTVTLGATPAPGGVFTLLPGSTLPRAGAEPRDRGHLRHPGHRRPGHPCHRRVHHRAADPWPDTVAPPSSSTSGRPRSPSPTRPADLRGLRST